MEEKGLGQQELIKPGQKLLPGVDEEAPQEAMKRERCWIAWVQVSRPGWGPGGLGGGPGPGLWSSGIHAAVCRSDDISDCQTVSH